MQPRKRLNPALAALIVVVLIGLIAAAVIAINAQNSTDMETDGSTDTSQPAIDSSGNAEGTYQPGSYSATGFYSTPGGRESIDLTLTIDQDGTITGTSLAQNATDGEARQYQAEFASAYEDMVVGKDIDNLSLSRVAGSSLTSNGFNQALDQIRDDAAV